MMGKLEDALEKAGQSSGGPAGGGLGGAVRRGVELQEGNRGATAEEQIGGQGGVPDQEGSGQEGRTVPTDPETAEVMESVEE
jgi:hypothetical protein